MTLLLIDTLTVITGRKIAEVSVRHSDLVVIVTKVDPFPLKGSFASIKLSGEQAEAYDTPALAVVSYLEEKAIHREGMIVFNNIIE